MEISSSNVNLALQDSKMEVMNFLNEIALKYPETISFAPGRPLEADFEVANSLGYLNTYVEHELNENKHKYDALGQYGRTNGIIGELVAKLLCNDEKVLVERDDVVVTVGCQEAMCLCLLALCGNVGDVALVVDPAYIGISGAAGLLGIELAAVPVGDDGIDLQAYECIVADLIRLKKKPKLLYISPDSSNPTGITTSKSQRNKLLEISQKLDILILEDHAYNYFQYDGERIFPLKSAKNSDHVIYLGSFSKSVFPGLRLGFLATTLKVRKSDGHLTRLSDEMSKIKSLLTVNTSPICQAIVGGLLVQNNCSLRSFVAPRRLALQQNRDAMLDALELNFPKSEFWCRDVIWNRPTGGFFLCLKVPFMVSDDDLILSAEKFGVLWTPMSYFYLEQNSSNEIRLSFSYVTPEQIQRGIAALSNMIKIRLSTG